MSDLLHFLDQIWLARYVILKGLGLTVSISALAIAAGSVLGILVGLSLTYGNILLRSVVRIYTDFVRGTPVLVLVLASFYILSAVGIDLNAFQAGVLALAVFCSSHVGEIVRGALQAIPKGQTEAAKAIGLTFRQTFVSVLWPQALRVGLPAYGNEVIYMLKGTAVASTITLFDLMGVTRVIYASTFQFDIYLAAAILYVAVAALITWALRRLEARLKVPGL